MTPLDFITTLADDCYNTPAGQIQETQQENIRIFSSSKEWQILSYYYNEEYKCMCLDIEKIKHG